VPTDIKRGYMWLIIFLATLGMVAISGNWLKVILSDTSRNSITSSPIGAPIFIFAESLVVFYVATRAFGGVKSLTSTDWTMLLTVVVAVIVIYHIFPTALPQAFSFIKMP